MGVCAGDACFEDHAVEMLHFAGHLDSYRLVGDAGGYVRAFDFNTFYLFTVDADGPCKELGLEGAFVGNLDVEREFLDGYCVDVFVVPSVDDIAVYNH